MIKTAFISDCERFRYSLTRTWDSSKPHVLFVLLNPSTADAEVDDATVRVATSFAKRWDKGGLKFVNLFAYRTTYPSQLLKAADPVGPLNNETLLEYARDASKIVVAWGTNGTYMGRDKDVMRLLEDYDLWCLGRTKDGHPRHPLRMKLDTPLELFQAKKVS